MTKANPSYQEDENQSGVGTSPRAPKEKPHKIEIGMDERISYYIIQLYAAYTSLFGNVSICFNMCQVPLQMACTDAK